VRRWWIGTTLIFAIYFQQLTNDAKRVFQDPGVRGYSQAGGAAIRSSLYQTDNSACAGNQIILVSQG
jgi:hypothetical protein